MAQSERPLCERDVQGLKYLETLLPLLDRMREGALRPKIDDDSLMHAKQPLDATGQ